MQLPGTHAATFTCPPRRVVTRASSGHRNAAHTWECRYASAMASSLTHTPIWGSMMATRRVRASKIRSLSVPPGHSSITMQ